MLKQLTKAIALTLITCSLGTAFAQSTPKWESLVDKDGDVVSLGRGKKLQIDMANTTGWGKQRMHVFYREVFDTPVKVNEAGQRIDEDRFEVIIHCSNVYKIKLIQRNWYLHDNHTNIFNFGDGKNMSEFFSENESGFNIIKNGCAPYDIDQSEDQDKYGKIPFTN